MNVSSVTPKYLVKSTFVDTLKLQITCNLIHELQKRHHVGSGECWTLWSKNTVSVSFSKTGDCIGALSIRRHFQVFGYQKDISEQWVKTSQAAIPQTTALWPNLLHWLSTQHVTWQGHALFIFCSLNAEGIWEWYVSSGLIFRYIFAFTHSRRFFMSFMGYALAVPFPPGVTPGLFCIFFHKSPVSS